MRPVCLACVLVLTAIRLPAADPRPPFDRFAAARERMVRDDLVAGGISDPRVLEAMRLTPRHEFLPAAQRSLAYFDMALPIGAAQTISGPFVVAYMTQQLAPRPDDRVLEIGTGSGYQAAVLSPLVAEVYSIEIEPSLGAKAARTLARLGYRNVRTKVGDGFQGWPEHAPFDKVIVTCSPEQVPEPLVDQLADGGRMVIPVGERFDQELVLLTKRAGRLEREALVPTLFVPMTGAAEDARQVLPDGARPVLRNGGFEDALADPTLPAAWYYGRQVTLVAADDAAQGARYLRLHNDQPGRPAQIFQGFAVDGTEVARLQVTARIRPAAIERGLTEEEIPALVVQFYDGRRSRSVRTKLPLEGADGGWRTFTGTVAVPTWAGEGSLMLALLGATGTLDVDDLSLRGDAR